MPPKPRRRPKTETDEDYHRRLIEWEALKPHDVEVKVKGNGMTQRYYVERLLPVYVAAIESMREIDDKPWLLQEDGDPSHGPKVVHQVPVDSIVPTSTSTHATLFHFPHFSSYIIPRQDFRSRPLTFCTSKYRVLGHPICIKSPEYDRNEYIFNFCLVLPQATEPTAFQTVVNKLASLFQSLESQSYFLSQDTSVPNTGKIYALCEILLEDLNNHCECMIPIDESDSMNIKLFPTYPPPPPIYPHHVPLSTIGLDNKLTDDNWDLTMLLILPQVNGLNSVKQIALRADADYKLVCKAISQLLYYECVIILDIFGFGACYAPTAEMAGFVTDEVAQEECRRYVLTTANYLEVWNGGIDDRIVGSRLVELYCSLKQGQSLRTWCMEHANVVRNIDVRRFITFGVIKGFLYRVHKYAFSTLVKTSVGTASQMHHNEERRPALTISKYLDGTHSFDQVCTELMISEKELLGRLKDFGDVQIIQR
ncbi:MAG: Nitrogen permease regulator 2 [Icmadophila ericetorum]|nr:Nitrogen permease regulator 2 [Icmadophila ericetorum]